MRDDAQGQVPFDGGAAPKKTQSGKNGDARADGDAGIGPGNGDSSATKAIGRGVAIRTIIAAVLVAVVVFAAAFAVGRFTEDPTKSQGYLVVEEQAAKVEEQVAENRKKTEELTEQRDDLRKQAAKAQKEVEDNKKIFGELGGNTAAGAEPLTIESISEKPDTFYQQYGAASGADKYYYPQITVRNTSGHVVYSISLRMDIVGQDGTVLESDATAYVSNIVLYPGKTAVCEGTIQDTGFSGATLKPTGYYLTIPDTSGSGGSDGTTTESHEFGKDVKTAVIS